MDYEALLKELDVCFYGTLIPRDPSEGIRRMKTAKDGWRHDVSHPFKFEGKTYDKQATTDLNVLQYNYLHAIILAKMKESD